MRPKSPTTTTKHPHLSVVQVFKESLRCRSEEARLCRTYIALSSISRIFFCAAPPKTRNNKTRNTRLPLPSRPAAPELKHRCAGRGAHYRQPNPDVKKKTTKNLSDQSRNTRTSTPAASTTPRKTTGHPRQAHSTCVALARRQPKKSPPPLHPTTANGRSDRHRAPMAIALRCATCVVPASRELLCSPRRSMPGALSFATMARADASVAVAAPWGK